MVQEWGGCTRNITKIMTVITKARIMYEKGRILVREKKGRRRNRPWMKDTWLG